VRRGLLVVIAIGCAAAGCAPPSALVPPHDPTFAAAQSRLARTEQEVAALHPEDDDRRLFLQAESMFDYRFSFPRRSTLGWLAEGAAAATDFPALQSFATSLDLSELRISAGDGAIQLWETMLARRPDTPLKPLALWRLGWAYRDTDVRGFPRRHGSDDAFAELIRVDGGSPLAALATEARETPWKSKSTAATLSLAPGAGQMYERRWTAGAIHLGVALAGAAMVASPSYTAYLRQHHLTWRRDWPLLAISTGGAVVISIDYTAAYQDAVRGAVEFNERREAAFEAAHPDAP